MAPKSLHTLTDDELIAHYQLSAHNQYLGTLLERHTLLLLGIAMKYLRDHAAAQDAVQQIYIKTITQFPKEPIHNFKGWLYILMRNHCLGLLRSQPHYSLPATLNDLPATPEKTTDEWLTDERLRQHMHQAINSLNPEQRTCIQLFYIQERSYKDIMTLTGYSFEQVKSYLQNGKRNLKITLQNTQPPRS
ncbi:MAG: sigma-70 family RNA polymerase sigma factor [Chitinophagaceae bacterium]|nr:sigma-70 family RNA polymerase sigma factor [Chitinophagaceae bacterium]